VTNNFGVSMPHRTFLSTGPNTPLYQGIYNDRDAGLMTRYTGSLYLARCQGYHKVGFTQKTATARVKQLEHGGPFPVELVHEADGTKWDEWCWHQRLWRHRVRGEWYDLPGTIVEELISSW